MSNTQNKLDTQTLWNSSQAFDFEDLLLAASENDGSPPQTLNTSSGSFVVDSSQEQVPIDFNVTDAELFAAAEAVERTVVADGRRIDAMAARQQDEAVADVVAAAQDTVAEVIADVLAAAEAQRLPQTEISLFIPYRPMDHFKKPRRANKNAAGADIFAIPQELSTKSQMIKTNVKISEGFHKYLVENNYYLELLPKSSKFDGLQILPGVIDADYRGEIFVRARVGVPIFIREVMAIAQLIVRRNYWPYCESKFFVKPPPSIDRGVMARGAMTKFTNAHHDGSGSLLRIKDGRVTKM